MKKIYVLFLFMFCTNVFAGSWGKNPTTNQWMYIKDNGYFALNEWIQVNNKWYYFGKDGFMLSNTITPDGYTVNANGEWVKTTNSLTETTANNSSVIIAPGMTTKPAETESSDIIIAENKDTKTVKAGMGKAMLYNNDITLNDCDLLSSLKYNNIKYIGNVFKFKNGGSLSFTATGTYKKLSFSYSVKYPKSLFVYSLQIYVDGGLVDTIEDFTSALKTYTLKFEKGSTVELIWNVETDGTSLSSSTQLYLFNAKLGF